MPRPKITPAKFPEQIVFVEDLITKAGCSDLSNQELADMLHVTPRTIQLWRSGDRAFPKNIAHLFCLINEVDWRRTRQKGSRIGLWNP